MPVRRSLALLLVAAASIASEEPGQISPPVPPPPISAQAAYPVEGTDPSSRSLMMWFPDQARCDGSDLAALILRRPLNTLVFANTNTPPVTLHFAVDETGRPHAIENEASPSHVFQPQDIAAAFAASRFMPGRAHSSCAITYSPRVEPLEQAPLEDLISYSVRSISGALPEAGWKRILSAGDCLGQPRPQFLLQGLPDFSQIRGTPGVRDWTLVRYDVDASGVPHVSGILASTGNAELDKASREAMANSRFTKVARTGCLYPYWRQPAVLPAPPIPQEPALKSTPGQCDDRIVRAVAARMRFPDAYKQRMIEGWAIVRYDVAPWGEVGNVTVLRAEPTQDFGSQAQSMLGGVNVGEREGGLTGCIQNVVFKIADRGPSEQAASE